MYEILYCTIVLLFSLCVFINSMANDVITSQCSSTLEVLLDLHCILIKRTRHFLVEHPVTLANVVDILVSIELTATTKLASSLVPKT